MINLDESIKSVEKKYSFSPLISNFLGDGFFSKVYLIEGDSKDKYLVGKFLRRMRANNIEDASCKINKLMPEYTLQKEIYDAEVSVPEPLGIYLIKNQLDSSYSPALVMEYILGMDLASYETCYSDNTEKLDSLKELRNAEISKAVKKGFIPGHDAWSLSNAMWVPENERIYLIDFYLWGRKNDLV